MDQTILDAFDLTGRVAVVTGAGGGIGREAARTFAGAGATVVVSDLPGASLDATVAALTAQGATVLAHPANVADKAQVEGLAAAALAAYGRIDVWANVAAVLRNTPFLDTPEDEVDLVVGVNLKGTYFGCQAAGRAMVAAGRGSIINTTRISPLPC